MYANKLVTARRAIKNNICHSQVMEPGAPVTLQIPIVIFTSHLCGNSEVQIMQITCCLSSNRPQQLKSMMDMLLLPRTNARYALRSRGGRGGNREHSAPATATPPAYEVRHPSQLLLEHRHITCHDPSCGGQGLASAQVTLHTNLLGVGGVIYTPHTLEAFKVLGLDTHTAIKLALKLHARSVQYAEKRKIYACRSATGHLFLSRPREVVGSTYQVATTIRALEKTSSSFNSHHQDQARASSSNPPGGTQTLPSIGQRHPSFRLRVLECASTRPISPTLWLTRIRGGSALLGPSRTFLDETGELMDILCVAGTVQQAKQPNHLAEDEIPLSVYRPQYFRSAALEGGYSKVCRPKLGALIEGRFLSKQARKGLPERLKDTKNWPTTA
eukprot:1150521-Pelagomonas_calceolata.AAC.6